jgi:hypothetical protein
MSEKIKVKQALQAFAKIRNHGIKTESGFVLDGLLAETSIDGYTLKISNDYVNLTILFHNKFYFDYLNNKEKDLFLEKIERIAKRNHD